MMNYSKDMGSFGTIGFTLLLSVFVSGSAGFLLSCGWIQKEFGESGVEDDRLEGRQYGDIPAPDDAAFQKKQSYSTTLPGNARVARIVYVSEHDSQYLESFYRRRMEFYNWKPSGTNLEGKGRLRFYSDQEVVKVKIDEKGNGESRIQIDIDRRR